MDALKRLMMKKQQEGHTLSPIEKDAKTSVLQALQKEMSDGMASKLNGLKKVTVAADNDHDLAKGLDKAKEVLHGALPSDDEDTENDSEGDGDEESPEHELSESPEEEMSEHPDEDASPEDGMSEEEINAQLEHLMKLKKLKGLA